MELAHAKQRSYYTDSAMLWNFLGSYPQNGITLRDFTVEIGCIITKFFLFSQIYFPMSGKVCIFAA